MLKFVLVNIMQHYAPASIVVCLLLCLSFNYTFPLHRDTAEYTTNADANNSRRCTAGAGAPGWPGAADGRATNATASLAVDDIKPLGKSNLSGDDLRQYEQMVIMKKYPYLDLKDLELKYHQSSGKNVRQNPRFAPERGFGVEPAICEPIDDGPNVEIFNRGLSGFAIPQLKVDAVEKLKVTNARQAAEKDGKKSPILDSLREDIREFEEKINSKLGA